LEINLFFSLTKRLGTWQTPTNGKFQETIRDHINRLVIPRFTPPKTAQTQSPTPQRRNPRLSRSHCRTAAPSGPHHYLEQGIGADPHSLSPPVTLFLSVSACRQLSVIMQDTTSKEHAMLLSVFLPFKFLSKDLIIVAITAYFIRGIVALS